jgi:glycosyltransferase involved in cell wall biosynthesis
VSRRTIAYLTSFYARAGDTFIRREVEELRRLGWTVHTFSIRRADDGEQVSEEIAREQRTTHYILERSPLALLWALVVLGVRSPRRLLRAVGQASALRWPGLRGALWHAIYLAEAAHLARELLRRDVALLHNHISMNSATVAALASTLSGIPFAMTVHGPHDFFDAERWALGQKVAASAFTVCVSSFGRSQCMLVTQAEHWTKLHEVHCGLDADYLAASAAPPLREPRLVCVGRLGPEKGQVLLVEAAAALRARGVPVEIVLVGDGPSRVDIERRARELGVGGLIQLVGWQGSAAVQEWIVRSRALVLPSFAEGIPVVLMEAMALRRPVIATFVGGVPELVRDGENGWLIPAASLPHLVDAMAAALGAPAEELLRMGERGRERILAQHDLAAETVKLASLFERAIKP